MAQNRENLTKRDIVLAIYEETGYPQKEIKEVVQMTLDVIMDAILSGKNVELRNFGVLEVQKRKQRVGRNPNEPEKDIIIPERYVIKFKAGKELKDKLNSVQLEDGLVPSEEYVS